MTGSDSLLAVTETQYGDQYRADFMTLFLGYVESAHQISGRRHKANAFFSSINTVLLAASGLTLGSNTSGYNWQIAVAGGLLCLIWWRMIIAYRDLNSAKFQVINEIEKHLPIAAYNEEWRCFKEAKGRTLTSVESWVPLLFTVAYLFVFGLYLYSVWA